MTSEDHDWKFSSVMHAMFEQAVRDIHFVHAAIPTTIYLSAEALHVLIVVPHREHGEPVEINFGWPLPCALLSAADARKWIYCRVRDTWEHELREALFVGDQRMLDPHS